MAILDQIHDSIVRAGIDHAYMLNAPDIGACITVAPYMSTPFLDIPMGRESFQVAARAADYFEANEMAWKALRAIDAGFPLATFRQSPTYVGYDEDRALCVFNFDLPVTWEEMSEERRD